MLDLKKIKKVHVIGIKGSGVVAVVEILHSSGISISGSDTHEKFFTDEVLKKMGILFAEEFSGENIPDETDLVIYSTAYNEGNNVEFAEAKKRDLPMLSYPEILSELFNEKYGIAVCGTHGKTTTSAMLASVLAQAGKDPSAVIGSRVTEWGSNALVGKSELFVIEADEYQNKLKLYFPKAAILTSVDWDHPDFFPTVSDYKKVFADFIGKIPKAGFLVVWGDSLATNEVACSCQGQIIKYGFQTDNDLVIMKKGVSAFSAKFGERNLGEFEMQLIGGHNMLDAAAVIALCLQLGVDAEAIREGIRNFKGTSRRFETVGQRNGAILIDDYGHHPEEIKVTLKAAREKFLEKNLIIVFHPHSYSRTEALLQDFAQSFDDADQVIVLDIYGSARENSGNVSSLDLVKLINKYTRNKAEHIPTIPEAVEFLQDKINEKDVVICIGAGNVFEVAEKLKEA